MVLDEVTDIVNDTSDGNESLAVLRLVDKVIPVDNGELLERGTPIEGSTLLVELLLELLNTALLDLVGAELLEVVGEANPLPESDSPLGGIVLPPLNGVAVVGRELVVEVVVTLTESDEGSDEVVTRRVAVIEGLVTKPVGKGVDAESSLLDEADTEDASVDITAHPVAPAEAADKSREDDRHEDNALDEVAVLPNDDGVLVEIGDIGSALALGVLLHDHPADMRVEETLANGVRVLVGVGVTVVSAMAVRPPTDRALYGTRATGSEKDLQRKSRLVGCVSPETMVSGCDTQASPEVVENSEDGGVWVKLNPVA